MAVCHSTGAYGVDASGRYADNLCRQAHPNGCARLCRQAETPRGRDVCPPHGTTSKARHTLRSAVC